MTTTQDLISRLRIRGKFYLTDVINEAADALEALQAENARHKLHIQHIGNDAMRTENAELNARLATIEMKYEPLPEADSSLPDNDLGSMISWVIVTLAVVAGLMWVCK